MSLRGENEMTDEAIFHDNNRLLRRARNDREGVHVYY